VDSVTSLAKFSRIVTLARNSPTRSIKFDPEAFTEEWFWVEYKLLKYPGPLREQNQRSIERGRVGGDEESDAESETMALQVDNYVPPLREQMPYSPLKGFTPRQAGNLLEPAIRLAAILFIEELVPDDPRSIGCYEVLLSLLNQQVRTIISVLRQRQFRASLSSLAVDDEGSTTDEEADDGLPSYAALRPLVIWASVIGYVVALVAEKLDRGWGGGMFDRSAYRECLALVVGPGPDFVQRLTRADLGMVDMFSLEQLRPKDWNDRIVMEGMLREHVLGEQYVSPPLTP
jgi:hypothetical protein